MYIRGYVYYKTSEGNYCSQYNSRGIWVLTGIYSYYLLLRIVDLSVYTNLLVHEI